jgi:hypothetical protein
LVTTRTWLIKDVCGNTNTCSQTVTVNCCTNCCQDCTTNNFVTLTVTVSSGYNYLVNPLCHGTNNTVGVLLPNVPDGTDLLKWDIATQTYDPILTFYSGSGGWVDNSTFNDASGVTLEPGQGFILQNPGGPYTLTWTGCIPTCPLPCLPNTNGLSVLVGGFGLGTASWTNLSSCPPICGTRVSIWNGNGFDDFDFFNGGWIPQAPVLAPGTSVFVSYVANTNCLPCTNNLVVNGGFEAPLVTGSSSFFTNGAVPGWKGYSGSCNSGTAANIELWGTGASIPPGEGSQDLEISSSVANETVCQTVTNVTPGCPANFCFMYTGRPGFDSTGQPYDNNFTVTLSGGYALSVPLDPPAYSASGSGWLYYCTSFVPTSSTLTIAFSRQPSTGDVGGAHIDKVTLTQCCTNPCITLTCSSDKAVQCGSNWSFDAPTNIVDTCCTNYSVTFGTVTNSGACPLVATRTWLISDACGHSNTCSQTVTVIDTTRPVITGSPAGGSLGCNPAPASMPTDASVKAQVRATDNCGLSLTNVTHVDGGTACSSNRTFTITVTDACTNTASTNVVYTWIVDTTPPVFTNCPASTNLGCNPVSIPDCNVAVGATDNCGGVTVGCVRGDATNGCGRTRTITYTAVDNCGNSNTCTQVITWTVDTTPPAVTTAQGANATIECPAAPSFTAPVFTDLCAGIITPSVTTVTNTIGCSNIITRTWTATDPCGNTTNRSQVITVRDTTPPAVTTAQGANATIECPAVPNFSGPVFTDLCAGVITPSVVTVTNTSGCTNIITRTWTANDGCGNSTNRSQVITVVDTTPPVITCATNKTVPCGTAWSFDAPVASDICSGTNVTLTFTTVTNGVCPQVITRTWTATDLCGNTNTCSQTVTVASCVPAPSGLTLWLPFDETSGTTSANLYSGGNNGTQINAPSVNLGGYVANSLCFNGANQSVSVPDYPAINPGTGDLSVDAWVKRDPASGTTVRIIVDKRNPTTTVGYSLSVSFGNLLFQLCDLPNNFTNYRDTGVLPADNQWHFIAVTVSRNLTNGGRFYIDGNPTGTFDPTGHPGSLNNTNAFLVATTPLGGATAWLGCIDEVEFFLRALAPSEVQGIFNAGPAGKCKSPELVCSTNKVVQCGTAWSFDPPVAATPCNGTNSLVVIGTVTNGACPTVVTRTWQLVDACGHTNTCSQTVSIVDTTAPVINCPSNIVMTTCTRAGVVVNYTITATDTCCTNVTIGSTPPSGSVFQPGSTTVSCTATDCCGNVSTCGFTVTVNVVNDTTPPVFTTYCTTNHIVFGGNNFATPVAATPSANLLARLNAAGIHNFKNFDECTVNTYFAHTFSGLPPCITSATLTMRLKPCGDICENDAVNLSFTGPGGVLSSNYWTRYLGSGNPQTGLVSSNWCSYTGGQVFTLDLSALPQASGSPLNDIPLLNANGFLDLLMQDDTGIDYAILDIVSCCCATNKTIPYGTPWAFDQPSAYDAVWGTNVTITSITQTSSLCPLVITRTWIATDPCGNSSTCSQTITIGQAGPCQIFNTGMAGTNGNIPVAIGSPDPNFALVSSPGAGTSCVIEGNLSGAWVPNTSTSKWVGPAIDTSSSPAGLYHYQLVFILCCTNNAQMNGRMAVDDSAGLYLNGNPAGSVIGYASYTPVNITSGFVPGVNVLDIYLTNAIIFTGLRAELTNCAGGMVVACSTNKVVDCGSPWSFDPPVASSCCSSNLSIVVTAASTNGNCPKGASRTWRITDGCGNTNFCTQTVTVRDTTPPVVACPNNKIIVALDANCRVHIPLIRPPAKDNCTPASQLVYTQNPPALSTVPGPCQLVTVTVRDACGNSTVCHVLVCGQDKTPPIVSFPKVITVTNCIVPNVLPFLTATDNCTPPNLLHFTQSPLPGTPIAVGGNIVTVTVTDQAGNTTTVVISLVNSGPNSFLNVMFNTGVDSSKVVVPGGSVDPHYTLGPVPGGTPTGGANYNAPNAIVMAAFWGLPPYTTSRWIDPEVNAWSSNPAGYYTYTNQFTLPAGANPLTASLAGRWAADDGAAMYFNGVLQPANGIPVLPYPYEQSGFNHWHPFTISSGFLANPAKNTILFVVTNAFDYSPGPTGVRVEYTNAVVNCSTCTPPAIVWLTPSQSRPLNSTAVFNANVWGTPPLTFQWYHNGVALLNGGHYSGVTTATLTITGIGYANAGTYYVCVSNPCGGLCSLQRKLNVTKGWWPWPWAWWDFSQIGNPMAATVGPDLILTGTNTLGISSGSTADFGLPNIGGQPANVINVPPLPGDTYIQLPFVAPPDSYSVSSYTLVMDIYAPTNGTGTNTLFEIGSAGQDSLRWLEATDTLIVSGTVGGVPVGPMSFNLSIQPAWNRVALVMDQPDDNASGEATLSLYVNGQFGNSLVIHGTPHVPTLPVDYLSDVPATLLSSQEGTSGEVYASSVQFHATAMTAEMIAGLGSPDNGPIPANDTSVGVQPVLSATMSNGIINLSWTGSTFVLQEATDLTSGLWADSGLPFDESEVSGDIVTTAHANPATDGPVKFYRLIYQP